MIRGTWLDRLVLRFQHRWETSPQYRATVSGVVGLVLLLIMCASVGIIGTSVNYALASVGILGNGAANQDPSSGNTGTNLVAGFQSFPIPTVAAYTPAPFGPANTIPDSQTPLPTPTAQPTAVPTNTPTPGGTGPAY